VTIRVEFTDKSAPLYGGGAVPLFCRRRAQGGDGNRL